MLLRKIIFYILFMIFLSSNICKAQTNLVSSGAGIYLKPIGESISSEYKRGSYVGDHYFGGDFSKKMNEFEMAYTYYKTSGGAYPTEQKMIYKPIIYNTTKKILKDYEKNVKKNKMAYVEAQNQAITLLDKVNKLVRYNTTDVELFLKKEKNLQEAVDFIIKIELAPL